VSVAHEMSACCSKCPLAGGEDGFRATGRGELSEGRGGAGDEGAGSGACGASTASGQPTSICARSMWGEQPVTLSATVGSNLPLHVATGTVTFLNGSTALGGVKVPKNGTAVFVTHKLPRHQQPNRKLFGGCHPDAFGFCSGCGDRLRLHLPGSTCGCHDQARLFRNAHSQSHSAGWLCQPGATGLVESACGCRVQVEQIDHPPRRHKSGDRHPDSEGWRGCGRLPKTNCDYRDSNQRGRNDSAESLAGVDHQEVAPKVELSDIGGRQAKIDALFPLEVAATTTIRSGSSCGHLCPRWMLLLDSPLATWP
jgi:hypothetical protein